MDPTADELIARLRSNPEDATAFSQLKAHYGRMGDHASLANLVEGWAARQRDRHSAAAGFSEAAGVVIRYLGDRNRGLALCERALENDPGQDEVAAWLQRLLEERGEYQRLADRLERRAYAMAQGHYDPARTAAVHQQLGQLWEQHLGRLEQAVAHYRRAFELDPTLVPAIYAAREIYRNAGNFKAAATLYDLEANAETDPERKVALLRELAHLRNEQLGELDGALVALKRAHGLAPEDLGVMHDMGTLLLQRADQLGQDEAAEPDRQRAAELFYRMAAHVPPEHAAAYAGAALDAVAAHEGALELLEDLAQRHGWMDSLPIRWVAFLQHAPQAPGADERRKRLADAYMQAGQPQDAILCLEPLAERGHAQAAETLIEAYRQTGRERDIPWALTVSLSSLPAREQASRLREAMQLCLEQGQTDAAIEHARALVELDPTDAEALSFLEETYRARGQTTELRDLLLSAARVPGLPVEARKQRLKEVASLSEKELDDPDSALSAWRALVSLDPADGEGRQALQDALERAGRWQELIHTLQREALALTDVEAKARVYWKLASVHRDQLGDVESAIEALRNLHELRPDDEQVRDTLSEELLEVGAHGSAVPLLWDRVDTCTDRSQRIALLRRLAEILEEHTGDVEGAFRASATLLDEEPGDLEALERMERIDVRGQHYERLLETLSYRAEVVDDEQKCALYRRMGQIADESLGDLERAGEYYNKALDLKPTDDGLLDALCTVYDRGGRYRDLVMLLRQRTQDEPSVARYAELYRRIARTLAERVRNEDGGAEAWKEVLTAGEDEEALRSLHGHAKRRDDVEEQCAWARRLAKVVESPDEASELQLERAELLVQRLDRPEQAAETLHPILDALPQSKAMLDRIAELCEAVGMQDGLGRALEARLALTEDADERLPRARRLSELLERELNAPERAIDALRLWVEVDPRDPSPRRRLCTLLEETERWRELVQALDGLAQTETQDEAVGEANRHAARVSKTRLQDVDAAWERLAPRARRGDEEAEQLLHDFALEAGYASPLAELYVQMAQNAPEPAHQRSRWLDAARIYEQQAGDPTSALEALLRAFALDLGDEALLGEVDRVGAAAGAWNRLGQVYDTLVRRTEDNRAKVRLLRRFAELLDTHAGDPSSALDRVLRACALAPEDDEVLAQAEDLAERADRAEDLLVVYDRRRKQAAEPMTRIEALLRAARLCERALGDRERAMQYVAQAVAGCGTDRGLLDLLEASVSELGAEETGTDTALKGLTEVYARVAEQTSPGEFGGHLLLRAARLLQYHFAEQQQALSMLQRAATLAPGDPEVLDELERLSGELGAPKDLDELLARLVREALDSGTAAQLLRRRGALLEQTLHRYDKAAEVYRQLLTIAPDATDVSPRLRSCLRKSERYQDLLLALDRELERVDSTEQRVELLKEVASTWEHQLKNRWEALDAWRQVLAADPNEPDANEAVKRLGHSTRKLSSDEIDEFPEPHANADAEPATPNADAEPATPNADAEPATPNADAEPVTLDPGAGSVTPAPAAHSTGPKSGAQTAEADLGDLTLDDETGAEGELSEFEQQLRAPHLEPQDPPEAAPARQRSSDFGVDSSHDADTGPESSESGEDVFAEPTTASGGPPASRNSQTAELDLSEVEPSQVESGEGEWPSSRPSRRPSEEEDWVQSFVPDAQPVEEISGLVELPSEEHELPAQSPARNFTDCTKPAGEDYASAEPEPLEPEGLELDADDIELLEEDDPHTQSSPGPSTSVPPPPPPPRSDDE